MPLDNTEGITLQISINSFSTNSVRTERVDGRTYTVINAMLIKANSVMNGIFYPADEVKSSYKQLEDLPAPLGHPKLMGQHVSARNNFAKGRHDIGAFIKNVKMTGDEVWGEVWVDNETASSTGHGASLMSKIAEKARIGVSTGLTIANMAIKSGVDSIGNAYNKVGHMFSFDHVAVLTDEQAAGADYGTEFVYNSETGDSLFVINHKDGQPSQTEENSMKVEFDISDLSKAERVQFGALTVNEIMAAVNAEFEPVSLDDAKEVVINAGLTVNSKEDGVFISNEDNELLVNFKQSEEARVEEIRDHIVTNSKIEAELLKDLSEKQLMGIYNSITPRSNDFSIKGTIATNAQDAGDEGGFQLIEQ